MKRKNVIIAAFACSPYQGSEDGVGWNVVTRMARYHDVTVLYGDCGAEPWRQREVNQWIETHDPLDGIRFCYVPQNKAGRFFLSIAHHGKRVFKPLVFLYYVAYRCWQKAAYQKAVELHEKKPFDLAHQLTYISYREPGYLWKLGIPFFWGPIAGVVNIPWKFFPLMSRAEQLGGVVRNVLNLLQQTGSRSVRRVVRASEVVWGVGREDVEYAQALGAKKAELMPVTGTHPFPGAQVRSLNPDKPLVMVWSGLHQGIKAFPILLKAWSRVEDPSRLRLIMLGAGPETSRWKKMAAELNLDRWIEWTGMLPLGEAVAKMNRGDLFVFTGIKEGTPTVIMEALSMGMPVICHDACGMSSVVDEKCGIKIPMVNPEASIKGFREAIQQFLNRPDLLVALSQGALKRAEALSWDAKVKQMSDTYGLVKVEKNYVDK